MGELRILIVEDDKSVSFLLHKMLTGIGYSVAGIVETGADALEMVEKELPDIILMDIMLKGEMDGIDAAIIIHNKFDLPVIFVTALSDDISFHRSKMAHPYGYLQKPFKLIDLNAAISIAISKIEMTKKLRESELWFKTTLASISDGIIATDNEENIKFMNPIAEALTGFSVTGKIKLKLGEAYQVEHDLSPEGLIYGSFEKSKNTADFSSDYLILMHKNGSSIPIEQSISKIKDDKGTVNGKVITFRDISQKREKELAVLTAKDYYLNILEKFPVPIWRSDNNGNFNYFNIKWLEYTGKSLASQIFKEWYKGIYPDDRKLFEDIFDRTLINLNPFEVEFRLKGINGEYHWFVCAGNPIYNLKGVFDGVVGVCYDITNRKAIEEELRRAKDLSETTSKAKSAFISNMSHEIRTPLNGIIGVTDLLLDSNPTREQKEYLGLINQASQTLLELLNNLLDFSRGEENKLSLDEYPFNLKEVVEEVIKQYSELALRNGVSFSYSLDPEIPFRLIGDGKKIKQIVTNLLNNAVKFTSSGSITVKIDKSKKQISNNSNGCSISFSISDTGIGIAPEMHDKIFESFTQVDDSFTRRYSGTGLGLAVVKRMLELMNGNIRVESTPGKGSNFFFETEFKL